MMFLRSILSIEQSIFSVMFCTQSKPPHHQVSSYYRLSDTARIRILQIWQTSELHNFTSLHHVFPASPRYSSMKQELYLGIYSLHQARLTEKFIVDTVTTIWLSIAISFNKAAKPSGSLPWSLCITFTAVCSVSSIDILAVCARSSFRASPLPGEQFRSPNNQQSNIALY